jgi:hypothetical protein
MGTAKPARAAPLIDSVMAGEQLGRVLKPDVEPGPCRLVKGGGGAMRPVVIPVARKLLAGPPGEVAELWVQQFANEEAAHDDALQGRLQHDFAAAFEVARLELIAAFGPPARVGATEERVVPLGGALRTAVWWVDDRHLWLAAAHEDRELPFHLLLGTAS